MKQTCEVAADISMEVYITFSALKQEKFSPDPTKPETVIDALLGRSSAASRAVMTLPERQNQRLKPRYADIQILKIRFKLYRNL